MNSIKRFTAPIILTMSLLGDGSAKAQEPAKNDAISVRTASNNSIKTSLSRPKIEDRISILVQQEKYRDLITLMNTNFQGCSFSYEDFDSSMPETQFPKAIENHFKRFCDLYEKGMINHEEAIQISTSKNKLLALTVLNFLNDATTQNVKQEDFDKLKESLLTYLAQSPTKNNSNYPKINSYNQKLSAIRGIYKENGNTSLAILNLEATIK
jgi:hypothetical protein